MANTYLIPKKDAGYVGCDFFPHYTASTHLQDHLGGDLLKMRCVHHTGVILCDYDQSSQLCWSYLEHQKRLGSYSKERFTLAEDVSRPLPSSITGPAPAPSSLLATPPPTRSQHLHDKRSRTCQVYLVMLTSQQGEKGT